MENQLEHLLQSAAADPAARPDFYRALLASDVFVIGRTDQDAPANAPFTNPAGSQLHIVNFNRPDGSRYIPFFTSIDALRKALDGEHGYISLPCKSLFELTKGTILVLNPGSKYGKAFLPNEIEALLETGSNHRAQRHVAKQDTRVLLGQPKDRPQTMLDALSRFFSTHPDVEAAYMCQMSDPASNSGRPSLLIGIRMAGESMQIYTGAGQIAADTAPANMPVDLVRVTDSDEGISGYLTTQTEPFYLKPSPKGLLVRLFDTAG